MAVRTTAFERAEALGWTNRELAERAGLSEETIYKVKAGERGIGPAFIEGMLRAFPNLSYRDLFAPDDSRQIRRDRSMVRPAEAAA